MFTLTSCTAQDCSGLATSIAFKQGIGAPSAARCTCLGLDQWLLVVLHGKQGIHLSSETTSCVPETVIVGYSQAATERVDLTLASRQQLVNVQLQLAP